MVAQLNWESELFLVTLPIFREDVMYATKNSKKSNVWINKTECAYGIFETMMRRGANHDHHVVCVINQEQRVINQN